MIRLIGNALLVLAVIVEWYFALEFKVETPSRRKLDVIGDGIHQAYQPATRNPILVHQRADGMLFSGAGIVAGILLSLWPQSKQAETKSSNMRVVMLKAFGQLLFLCGCGGLWHFFTQFQTTVLSHGERIHNLGLLNERTNGLVVSGLCVLVGTLFMLLPQGPKEE